MALNTKYRIEFADRDGALYRVNIKKEGVFTPILLDGTASPVTIEYESAVDKFNAVNASGCSLSFYNNGSIDASDFFTIGLHDIQVEIQRECHPVVGGTSYANVWSGWVNPEALEEDYTWDEGMLTMTANDGLSAAKREKFFSGADLNDSGKVIKPWALGLDTVRNVIVPCLSECDIDRIYTIVDVAGSISTFDSLSVDLSNYVDEDFESMTRYEVLESILTPLSLRLYLFGSACWIIDPIKFKQLSTIVPFNTYDSSFTYISTGSLDCDTLVGDSFYFVDGSQTMSLVGGFKTMISNYSAYPDTRKIIPFQPDEIEVDPTAVETVVTYTSSSPLDGFYYKEYTAANYADFGLINLANVGLMTGYKRFEDDEYSNAFGIVSLVSNQVESQKAITINAGWIPKTTDFILIDMEVLVDTASYLVEGVDKIEIPVTVKIGSKYGVLNTSRYFYMSSTTPVYGILDTQNIGSATTMYRQWVSLRFLITGIDEGGFLELSFHNKVRYFKYSDGSWIEYHTGGSIKKYFFMKNLKITINNTEISDEDVEFKTESGINFINSTTIEINNASRRENGCLDRGAFYNTSGEHETYFTRGTTGLSGSIGTTLAQGYMGNYTTPFRRLNATLQTTRDLLRNTTIVDTTVAVIPKAIDAVITPMNILIDQSGSPSKRFIFSGGTIDLVDKTISGSWDELFDANYTITEI